MKYLLVLTSFLLLQCSTATQEKSQGIEQEITEHAIPTVIYIVRHAEKAQDGTNDPDLNDLGIKRADKLSMILNDIEPSAIYSSPYKRTQQTAQPTAENKELEITAYNPSDQKAFVDEVLKSNKNQTILIVGHSNTVPELLNILSNTTKYQQLGDDEYDKLFIVSIDEKGIATVEIEQY